MKHDGGETVVAIGSPEEGEPYERPEKNRLHDYEAGWLTLLVETGVATKQEAHDAMCRVAQAAIDDVEEKRKRRKEQRRRRPE